MPAKCPNCGSMDTAAAVGDITHCLSCGRAFDSKGNLVAGPDKETRDALQSRLDKTYEPNVVGNLADLQRLGAENASDKNEPAFVLPAGAEDAADQSKK